MSDHPDPRVARLQALLRLPTVSRRDRTEQHDGQDDAPFDAALALLREHYPLLHERCEITVHSGHALLVRWPGRGDGDPVVLMAHLDVVPVETQTWAHDPFGAEVVDGVLWGRGVLDDKGSLVAICEAVEALLAEGVEPARDVWLSFGCDEEVFGAAAPAAVDLLRERGVTPWFVLDEGGAVAAGALPGVARPLAVVGVTEKGATTLELLVTGEGGHASTPTRNGPPVRLARALTRVDAAPLPASMPAPTLELLRRAAPHAPLPLRPVLAGAARLQPLLTRLMVAAGPETAATLRTTVAVTTMSASPAANVLATTARAALNVRVMLGDTVAGVVDHVRRAIDDDRVEVSVVEAGEASPLSPWDGDPAFALLEECTRALFADAVPTPYVMMAATDARHFTAICERVYRFTPFRMSREQRAAIHAADEHLAVDDWLAGVAWYRLLLERLPA